MRWTLIAGLIACAALACDDGDGTDPDPIDALDDGLPDQTVPDASLPDQMVPDPDAAPMDGGVEPDQAPPDPDMMVRPRESEWTPCLLNGEEREGVECIEEDVVLLFEKQDSPWISVFVKRVRPAEPDGRSLWLLAGGPGQAGDAFEPMAQQIAEADPGLTIYIPDHRGTGRSSRLSCPRAEHVDSPGGQAVLTQEWADCYAEVTETYPPEQLKGFGTTAAALDLVELMNRFEEREPYLLGVSYGTFLAWRFLQIAPEHAAGVVFDSACMPGECFLSAQDLWEDRVGREWFDTVCAGDALCNEKLGERPTEAVEALHAALQDGQCPLLGGDPVQARATLRVVLGQLFFFANLRPVLPALVYRMLRCSPADQQAIAHLFNAVFGGGGMAPSSYSWPLAMNIAVSEMWEPSDPTPEEIVARYDDTVMCRGVSNQVAWQAPEWSRYVEPWLDEGVETAVPTLIMQAEYDPATPVEVAEPMTTHLDGPNQHFVVVQHA